MTTIQIIGNNLVVTPAIEELINKKLSRLEKYSEHITSIQVFLTVDKHVQAAEINILIPNHKVSAKASSEDLYKTIDLLADKATAQLKKIKGKLANH